MANLVARARHWLSREDPLSALAAYTKVRALAPDGHAGLIGMAETYLFMGKPALAQRYLDAVLREGPRTEEILALHVRILIRAARFDAAVEFSTGAILEIEEPGAELLAAHASALFRVQRTSDAAAMYQRVLRLDPLRAEAHLRLGSGLLPPRRVPHVRAITRGIAAQRAGQFALARDLFAAALRQSPSHPVAHRLLAETIYQRRFRKSMVHSAACYRTLAEALPVPSVEGLPLDKFFPHYGKLTESQQRVAARALNLFASLLPKLVVMHGRHDILRADERTTDALVRAPLRGKRTFDGRVWDDVRGIGGLRAATGIEALDEAARFEFNTLSHELAHQAHLYAFRPVERARLRALYRSARKAGRCLDFYAASNEAEYFGQGVEAFVSLAKRPGCEKTHGHTRFELLRVDPALYRFVEKRVEFDPLRTVAGRARLLRPAVEVALIAGRPEDAVLAAEMMDAGELRERWVARAQRALKFSKTY